MQITRREIVRRLGGLVLVGALYRSTRFLLNDGGDSAGATTALGGDPMKASSPVACTINGENGKAAAAAATPSTTHHQTTASTNDTPTTAAGDHGSSATETPAPGGSDPSPSTTAHHATPSTTAGVVTGSVQLAGAIGPLTISKGATATIVGNVDLKGDLVVEGLLTGVDTFLLKGNGRQIEVRNGGRLDLRGKPKTGWIRGGSPSGWKNGDRVVTAPNAKGRFALSDFKVGSWPVGSASSVTLLDGRKLPAEQFNLDRSIVIDGVSRIMMHHGAGKQTLKHLAVRNAGKAGELGFYPVHFHLNGNTTRGSVVEGVVVENGKNHAFVPHGSNGISMVDCVAFNTIDDAFWWDPPLDRTHTANNSNDTLWKHCLVAYVVPRPGGSGRRLTGFVLGAGSGNRALDCSATGIQGTKDSSGFHWPEGISKNVGGQIWEFRDCVSHNNVVHGIMTWQNASSGAHLVDRFVAYRNGEAGVDHGAYNNQYIYRNLVLHENGGYAVESHATGIGLDRPVVFENVNSDGHLAIQKHGGSTGGGVFYRKCRFTHVHLRESGSSRSSIQTFEDCGLNPDLFTITNAAAGTVLRIVEGGSLLWEWNGSWQSMG